MNKTKKTIAPPDKGEIVIYQTSKKEVELKVRLEKETIWLTQAQIARLFGTQRPAITKHLRNVLETGELNKNSVSSILEHTAADGKIYRTQFYNLDAIISVGYRVNSKRATQFRIWATKILKDYIINGYTINQKRLLEVKQRFQDLQETIAFLQSKSQATQLQGQAPEMLNLLSNYAKTLSVLNQYDNGQLTTTKGRKGRVVLKYDDCARIITQLKSELKSKKEASDLFGNERQGGFESVVKNLYQTYAKQELYPTIEDKAAHLLYLTIKDHPFTDGNKRIAAFMFVYFLDRNQYLYKRSGERKINDNGLTALALLIATSAPKEKEVMIKIIKSLLTA